MNSIRLEDGRIVGSPAEMMAFPGTYRDYWGEKAAGDFDREILVNHPHHQSAAEKPPENLKETETVPITIEGLRPRDEMKPERWVVFLSRVVKFFQAPLVVLGYVLKLA